MTIIGIRCLSVFGAALLAVPLFASPTGRAQQQRPEEARPRRAEPTPSGATPVKSTPQPKLTPATPSTAAPTTPNASQSGSAPSSSAVQQQQPSPSAQPPVGQEVDDNETLKIDTNLVNLQVRVIDRLNRPINDVRQDDFRVFEDGVPQTISFITKEEVPINYGLVIDNSGSLRSQIEKVIDTGKTIVGSNKQGDETFLIRFIDSEKIEMVQDFTPNKDTLIEALETLYVEGGQTAVIDAVYLAAERAGQYKKGDMNDRRRRALILVTDGEDRNSQYKQEQLFARLREADVQIFVIGFVNELDKEGGFIRKSPRDKAVNLLERLAKETGGRVFFPTSTSELPRIAEEITRDLRTQYVISYNPTNKTRDGSYRTVRVTVADAAARDKRIAITRPGYTARREGEIPKRMK